MQVRRVVDVADKEHSASARKWQRSPQGDEHRPEGEQYDAERRGERARYHERHGVVDGLYRVQDPAAAAGEAHRRSV